MMHIQIRNFGPVKAFYFDLKKDFVVIFGKNNLGKSYAISAVYLVLKNLLNLKTDKTRRKNVLRQLRDYFLNDALMTERDEKAISVILFPLIQTLQEEIEESFYNTFDGMDKIINPHSQEIPSVTIKQDQGELTMAVQEQKRVLQNFCPPLAEIDKAQNLDDNRYDELDRLLNKVLFFLHDDNTGKTETSLIFLPASRSGLYQGLNTFSQIMVELSKSRRFATKKFELLSISEPYSDYFLGLSNLQPKKLNPDNPILSIVNEIEQTILKGEVIFDEVTKKRFYKPHKTDLVLDVSATSSMVSELSPIVCYLKYKVAFANAQSILFIEEPEAHLHPETQVQLMAIFAKLVKANVKIVITSHSDYMFNKMNNLIL